MSADASAAAAQAATDAAAKATADAAAKSTADASAKAAADQAATDAAAKATEYKFVVPEGVKLEGESLTQLTTFAKTHKLTQEAAQALVDREIGFQKEQAAAETANVKKVAADWEAAAKADAEIGGEKHAEHLAVAKKALETFGSKPFQDMLNTLPIGKHPEVVRFLAKVGRAISADGKIVTGAAGGAEKTAAQTFYPTMVKTGT